MSSQLSSTRSHETDTTITAGDRRPWLLFAPLALLIVLALINAAKPPIKSVAQQFRPLPMPPLVECSVSRPSLIVGVFDVSDSVIARGGADSRGHSFSEFRAVIDALSADPCTPDDRVGALIFAADTVEVPPTLVSSASVAKTTIRRPPASEIGGSTNMTVAFERAQDMETRFADYDVVFVVFSDNQADSVPDAEDALKKITSPVHAVALGEATDALDASYASTLALRDLNRGDIATSLVDIINQERNST